MMTTGTSVWNEIGYAAESDSEQVDDDDFC